MVWTRSKPATAGAPATAAAPTGAPPPPTAAAPAQTAPAAAALPPLAQPAAPTPAAAAPAAEPARRGRRAAAPAVAAVAPAEATPVQPVATTTVAQQIVQLPGFLAVLTPRTAGPSGAAAIINGRTSAGEPNIFPVVYLTGGDTGGALVAHDMNPEGVDADLPVGKDPFKAILLGARFELLIWPKAFERGIKVNPRSKAVIAYDNHAVVDIVQRAVQRYQFRNRATQDQYDTVGHPTMLLELLVYDPQAGIYGIQTTGGYESLFATCQELGIAFPVVTPTPVEIGPYSYDTKGSKTQKPWKEHCIQIRQDNNSQDMQAIKTEFNKFLQENGSSPDLAASMAAWAKETITADQIEDMKEVAEIR